MTIHIRLMTRVDIPYGMRFREAAGWNQTEADWERFLGLEPEGCFVAEVDGEVVGTATTCRFGQDCGWVAMILVPPERRRQGIGSALFRHAVAYLEGQGVASVKLDATPVGRTVYLQVGFVDEYELQRREGIAPAAESHGVIPMAEAHLDAVLTLDRPIYGADRSNLLIRLHREAQGAGGACCGVFQKGEGEVEGYAMVRPGGRAAFIGPVVARTEEAGVELLRWAMGRVAGQPVFFDIPMPNPVAVRLVDEHGFAVQRPFTRMYRGVNCPGDPTQVYATSGPEKG